MKYLFLVVFLLLVAAGVGTVLTEPDMSSDVPVIYWSTDANPARVDQVELFHTWLVEEGHVTDAGAPVCELRLDIAAASDPTKKVVQAVAGVAADVMDVPVGQMVELGVLRDVTDAARRLGFSPAQTYPAIEPGLVHGGRQVAFPCNVGVKGFLANGDAFRRVGLEPPAEGWTLEAFEAAGRAFVKAANPPGTRNRSYFFNSIIDWGSEQILITIMRSQGLGLFNETMTACTLDDPRYAEMLERVRRWMYVDRLTPTGAEVASLSGESGYGGASMDLFVRGRYAMYYTGRFALIGVRKYPRPETPGQRWDPASDIRPTQPELFMAFSPHAAGGVPNDVISGRTAGVYKGSRHPELAELFLAFLASRSYNEQVIRDADALPPNPAYVHTPAFREPEGYENEWRVHAATEWATANRAAALDESPFVPTPAVTRLMLAALERVTADPPLATAAAAAADAGAAINDEIRRALAESPRKVELHARLTEVQKKIDARRAAGRPVPEAWITNPFHRYYYRQRGWLEEDAAPAKEGDA